MLCAMFVCVVGYNFQYHYGNKRIAVAVAFRLVLLFGNGIIRIHECIYANFVLHDVWYGILFKQNNLARLSYRGRTFLYKQNIG